MAPVSGGSAESGNTPRSRVQTKKRSRSRGRIARREQRERQALQEAVATAKLLHDKAQERQGTRASDEDRFAKAVAVERLTTDLKTLYEEHRSLRPAPTPDRVHAPAAMVGEHGKPRAIKKRGWTDLQVTENLITTSNMEETS